MLMSSESLSESLKIDLRGGFVRLVDVMGTDYSIESAARVSYGRFGEKRLPEQTRNLLRYMMRHHHTSPFEMAEMIFHIKLPIFVERQWARHRTASWNEISGRYSELPEDFWTPEEWRGQSKTNKQGSEGEVEHGTLLFTGRYAKSFTAEEAAFEEYRARLASGVSRELARTCLPFSTFTEKVWKIDLNNLFKFFERRLDSHAQKEIRDYAEYMARMVQHYFPLSWEAFEDYRLKAVTFSRLEIEALKSTPAGDISLLRAEDCGMSEREFGEFKKKIEAFAP